MVSRSKNAYASIERRRAVARAAAARRGAAHGMHEAGSFAAGVVWKLHPGIASRLLLLIKGLVLSQCHSNLTRLPARTRLCYPSEKSDLRDASRSFSFESAILKKIMQVDYKFAGPT